MGQLLRSTRDFRVSWCSHCFAIELPKAPPRAKEKACPACRAGLRPEWDEADLDGRRLVFNLRYACNECGHVKPWPLDCYLCGAEEDVHEIHVTEVIYRGRRAWTGDRLLACGGCLPRLEHGLYDTQVDRVTYTKTSLASTCCVHCPMDGEGLGRARRASARHGALDLFQSLLCPACRERAAALP